MRDGLILFASGIAGMFLFVIVGSLLGLFKPEPDSNETK